MKQIILVALGLILGFILAILFGFVSGMLSIVIGLQKLHVDFVTGGIFFNTFYFIPILLGYILIKKTNKKDLYPMLWTIEGVLVLGLIINIYSYYFKN